MTSEILNKNFMSSPSHTDLFMHIITRCNTKNNNNNTSNNNNIIICKENIQVAIKFLRVVTRNKVFEPFFFIYFEIITIV